MITQQEWQSGGVVRIHEGPINRLSMLRCVQDLLECRRLWTLKYIVSDFARASKVDVNDRDAAQIGWLVRNTLGFMGLRDANIKWAVISQDRTLQAFALTISRSTPRNNLIYKSFSERDLAMMWAITLSSN